MERRHIRGVTFAIIWPLALSMAVYNFFLYDSMGDHLIAVLSLGATIILVYLGFSYVRRWQTYYTWVGPGVRIEGIVIYPGDKKAFYSSGRLIERGRGYYWETKIQGQEYRWRVDPKDFNKYAWPLIYPVYGVEMAPIRETIKGGGVV